MLTYAIFSQNGGTLGYKYLFRMTDHYSPLECMSCFFFVIMCICLTNHVRFLLHSTIFCKKCLHKQFFLKMVELWDINIYFVWKTTIVLLSVCQVFFCYKVYLLNKSRSFLLHRTLFWKKCLHKQFFLKLVELWDINIYFAWKTTIVPLSVCRVFFFCYNVYLFDKSRSFLLHRMIFCKKCLHKQFFLKMVELWDINIYFVWKTTIVPLSVCRVFLL